MSNGRLARTSYGYLPPPDARANGWICPNGDCGRGERPAPAGWPYPCPGCGTATDPQFEPPWDHEAEGLRQRHLLGQGGDPSGRHVLQGQLALWQYQDAWMRGDRRAATGVRHELRNMSVGRFMLVTTGIGVGDLDGAAEELLAWYPTVETEDADEDQGRRAEVRGFVNACLRFLRRRESIGHPSEPAVHCAMVDVATRAEDVLLAGYWTDLREIQDMRASISEQQRITQRRRSHDLALGTDLGVPGRIVDMSPRRLLTGRRDRAARRRLRDAEAAIRAARSGAAPEGLVAALHELVTLLSEPGHDESLGLRAATALAGAALTVAELHDDGTSLVEAAERLSRGSAELTGPSVPSLVHLLQAHVRLASLPEDREKARRVLTQAMEDLRQAATAADRLAPVLLPEIRASLGQLIVRDRPEALDEGIAECRRGRLHGRRPWRRATAADLALARLLVRRALESHAEPVRRMADVKEALRLGRRQCRPWRSGGPQAHLVLMEAVTARDALTGADNDAARAQGWRRAVDRSVHASTADRARLARAWAAWAVGTGDVELAADAYHHVVTLIPLEAATRYRSDAKDRLLAAAQEYTEEAGYWLARAGRYRDAAVALETGRAVALSQIDRRDDADLPEALRRAGHSRLGEDYRRALHALESNERHPSPSPGAASPQQRAWAQVRSLARRIAEVTGVDPLALDVGYDDILAVTADGPVVYLAAAKSGGYALIVAARHDPQFVDLPKLDRASVEALCDALLPQPTDCETLARIADGLKQLWDRGIGDVFYLHARGQIITLVPVGLLSLLPLHAVGDPGVPGDRMTEWRHVGNFSAVRYAPNARMLARCSRTVERLSQQTWSLLAADVRHTSVPDYKDLEWAAREREEVERAWRDRGLPVRSLPGCTWEDFGGAGDECSVWHLACHGRADPDAILESSLAIADRAVTLAELGGTVSRRPRRLAVLSSCESQVTGTTLPNEAVGLPAVLLESGFAGVIATAWSVDDRATMLLMTRFYELWCARGLHPAVALNCAQQWLRQASAADLVAVVPDTDVDDLQGPHPFAHPWYWAAFAYTGA